jgi:hypothetical protein
MHGKEQEKNKRKNFWKQSTTQSFLLQHFTNDELRDEI